MGWMGYGERRVGNGLYTSMSMFLCQTSVVERQARLEIPNKHVFLFAAWNYS